MDFARIGAKWVVRAHVSQMLLKQVPTRVIVHTRYPLSIPPDLVVCICVLGAKLHILPHPPFCLIRPDLRGRLGSEADG